MNCIDQQNILLLYKSSLLFQQDYEHYAFPSSDLTVYLAIVRLTFWHSRYDGEMKISYSYEITNSCINLLASYGTLFNL